MAGHEIVFAFTDLFERVVVAQLCHLLTVIVDATDVLNVFIHEGKRWVSVFAI
jgi:hypothetical protein